MDDKYKEEIKQIQPTKSDALRSKICIKQSENTNIKKPKSSLFKSNSRNRSKTIERVSFKDQMKNHTNIPQSVAFLRSRSYDKTVKPVTCVKKPNEANEKNKCARSKSASESCKSTVPNEELEVQAKTLEFSKETILSAAKNKLNEDVQKKRANEEINFKSKGFKGFTQLLPLFEKELKKIEQVWMNTIYCSLTMRSNLVQLLFQMFPYIDKAQFQAEDKKLAQCLDEVKTSTKLETENLIQLVKSLMMNREKTKEEYLNIVGRNSERTEIRKKKTEPETKQLKADILELQKKKEAADTTSTEKPQKPEMNENKKKDTSILSLFTFGNQQNCTHLNPPKQKESSKKNTTLNVNDSKKIESEFVSLISAQREFEDLKKKYSFENEACEKKIKDLETLLEEKTKILKQEKEIRNRLSMCLSQFQTQQNRLTSTIGNEQLEFLMGRSCEDRDKMREGLWLSAIKLILKGFSMQLKKLEIERNKMLLQLQSNDPENLKLAAAIIQKDNFVKSIKQQMRSYNKAYQKTKNNENLS